jgi:type II secretory pathway pseudopilin PulG
MRRRLLSPPRLGLTLVELLVVVALDVMILSILAYAFATGSDLFTRVKALGDLDVQLRSATTALRHDLRAYHFEGSRRVSDPWFWDVGPPREGFFRIWQGSPSVFEGRDAEGIGSWRATDHALHFTVRRTGNRPTDFFWTRVPRRSPLLSANAFDSSTHASYRDGVGRYASQWAEVAYFLRPTETTDAGTLYALYRRQLLVVPNASHLNWPAAVPASQVGDYFGVSNRPNPAAPGELRFNDPMDLTIPERRFGMRERRAGGYPTLAEENPAVGGADLMLTDVLSFNVRLMVRGIADFADLADLGLADNPTFAGGPRTPRVFDTWSHRADDVYDYTAWNVPGTTRSVPLRVTPQAVQITIRLWHRKTQQARQVTIVHDL